jgi:N-acetylmuramoyl-L-alanine amidase
MRSLAPVLACLIALSGAATADALGTGRAQAGQPVVVIDPGHDAKANLATEPIGPGSSTRKIKDGGGTRGVVTGIPEPVLALAVAKRLRRLLEDAGVRVVMTRTRTAGVSLGNVARARIANEAGADLFLRIHADGSSDRSVRGTHTLIPARLLGWTDDIYAESKRAGRLVQGSLVTRLGSRDRGLDERSDITGFNWADVPSILVEMGYMSNPVEDRLLAKPGYRAKAARGLCEGVLRFLDLAASCSAAAPAASRRA